MNRTKILQEIFSHFQAMTQWITSSPTFYVGYFHKANALIELLEVEDCGSVGGVDINNPVDWRESGLGIYNRFLALLRKENTKLKKECYFTPETMRKYWVNITSQREVWNK